MARIFALETRFVAAFNQGALMLMLSIGHRNGLFDVMGPMPPSNCAQIAERAGLSERYVR